MKINFKKGIKLAKNPVVRKLFLMNKNKRVKELYNLFLDNYYNCFYKSKCIYSPFPSPFELLTAFDYEVFLPEPYDYQLVTFGNDEDVIDSSGLSTDTCSVLRFSLGAYKKGLMPEPELLLTFNPHSCDMQGKIFTAMNKDKCYYMDVPYDEKNVKYFREQLIKLKEFLEKKNNVKLDEEKLKENIRVSGEIFDEYIKICKLRKEKVVIKSSEMWGLHIAVMSFGKELLPVIKNLRKYLEEAEPLFDKPIRLMTLHVPSFYNKILDKIEDMGATVVFDEFSLMLGSKCEGNDPYEAIAKKCCSSIGNKTIQERINIDLKIAKEYKADGVIHFSNWGCKQGNACVRSLREAFNKEGIPFLELDVDLDRRNQGEGQTLTRLQTFIDMLKK